LSKVLRHSAEEEGIIIRPDGFMLLNDVLKVHFIAKFNATLKDIQSMVASNAKQRYEIKENTELPGQYLIRAVQGHSIKTVQDEELLCKLSEDINEVNNVFNYVSVCHGTYKEVLKPILETGMCRMTRNNIHFAPGLYLPGINDVISGMRNSC
jgi:2'-phosphotransferase